MQQFVESPKFFKIPLFLAVFFAFICACGAELDKSRYITVDEVREGMDAYCLTVYQGTNIEKFALEVVSVVKDIRPGKDAIIVIGTDERFIHTGPVAGCSGSPVYIDGRLAGALAFGWSFSKDALYGVTPIEEMLEVGQRRQGVDGLGSVLSGEEFSNPIDFEKIYEKFTGLEFLRQSGPGGSEFLPSPMVSSVRQSVCDKFRGQFRPLGLLPVSGGGAGRFQEYQDGKLEPGAILAVPLCTGDIETSVVGTVTEVVDDKVYGFGHSFLGIGPVDMPMGTGYVHTVVANLVNSFKFGQAVDIKGALRADESAAVYGEIGEQAKMIPVKITVDRFNDEKRVYNCQIVSNRILTPIIANYVVQGGVFMKGDLPLEHTVEYKSTINVKDLGPISFSNVSSNDKSFDMSVKNLSSISMMMNNPFERVDIESMEFEIKITSDNRTARIWSIELGDTKLRQGEKVRADIVLQGYLDKREKRTVELALPADIQPGRYKLQIGGGEFYRQLLVRSAPYRYVPQDAEDIIEIINEMSNIPRNQLYAVIDLPAGGIAIEKAELPMLPASRAAVLKDARRTLASRPVARRVSANIKTEIIPVDSMTIEIIVEKKK